MSTRLYGLEDGEVALRFVVSAAAYERIADIIGGRAPRMFRAIGAMAQQSLRRLVSAARVLWMRFGPDWNSRKHESLAWWVSVAVRPTSGRFDGDLCERRLVAVFDVFAREAVAA